MATPSRLFIGCVPSPFYDHRFISLFPVTCRCWFQFFISAIIKSRPPPLQIPITCRYWLPGCTSGQRFCSLCPLHYLSLLASWMYIRQRFSSVSATLLVAIVFLDVHPGSASALCFFRYITCRYGLPGCASFNIVHSSFG